MFSHIWIHTLLSVCSSPLASLWVVCYVCLLQASTILFLGRVGAASGWVEPLSSGYFAPLGYFQPPKLSCPSNSVLLTPVHGCLCVVKAGTGEWGEGGVQSPGFSPMEAQTVAKHFASAFSICDPAHLWAASTFGSRPSFVGLRLWFPISWPGFTGIRPSKSHKASTQKRVSH